MNADDILNALRKAWPTAAIVPEPLPGMVVENIAHRAAAYAVDRRRHD